MIQFPLLFKLPSTKNRNVAVFASRSNAGVWRYLPEDGAAAGSGAIPGEEYHVAESLYQHITAASREGVVIKLRDGSHLRSVGAGEWAATSPSGNMSVRLTDHERGYIADIARALGTEVLLANATELERQLREQADALRTFEAERAQLLKAWQALFPAPAMRGVKPMTAEELLAETELVVGGLQEYVAKMGRQGRLPVLIKTVAGSRVYMRASEDSAAVVDTLTRALEYATESKVCAQRKVTELHERLVAAINGRDEMAGKLAVAQDPIHRAIKAALWGLIGVTSWHLALSIWA